MADNLHETALDDTYCSEDDGDYLPSDGESGDDELDEKTLEKDDGIPVEGEIDSGKTTKKRRTQKEKESVFSRRKRGQSAASDSAPIVVQDVKKSVEVQEETRKKKIDDLWASLQQKTAQKPTSTSKPTTDSHIAKPYLESKTQTSQQQSSSSEAQQKVKVAEILDFAGEKIRLERTVVVGSKEEKKLTEALQKEEKREQLLKRPASNLDSIIAEIGKKKKMNTLDKSRMDWDQYKEKTQISDELKHATKGGYLDKMAFLNRVDSRINDNLKSLKKQLKPS
eukprot:TRINITY_DN3591_c0_g1_i4.p1 TRINITY_DN3591_c0_g1~~TRINITY_DN3591_c0_g1_i4.p1  ORF type:complete len:281 (-),score=77.54 TRINITY_DN3591_c0_g1_i4:376-1218(-)